MPQPNHIHLVIQTLSGTYDDDFNIHQKLEHVVRETFKHLHIDPSPGDAWELHYGDRLLSLDQSIEEAGLPDDAVLLLAVHEGGGGRGLA